MYIDFEFNGRTLSDFGFIMCSLNTNSSMREVEIGCELSSTFITNKKSNVRYRTSNNYENVYAPKFDIIKNPCNDTQDIYITHDEVSAITRWLNIKEDKKFVPYEDFNSQNYDGSSYVCYFGSFNVAEILLGDNIIGLTLTFNSNAPYGFGQEIIVGDTITSTNTSISILGEGDEVDNIFPTTSILCRESGTLKITNRLTNISTIIKNCQKNETIVMDSENSIIYTDNIQHNKTLYNDFNYNYIEIQSSSYDRTENIFDVSLPSDISITYRPIRKVGVL